MPEQKTKITANINGSRPVFSSKMISAFSSNRRRRAAMQAQAATPPMIIASIRSFPSFNGDNDHMHGPNRVRRDPLRADGYNGNPREPTVFLPNRLPQRHELSLPRLR